MTVEQQKFEEWLAEHRTLSPEEWLTEQREIEEELKRPLTDAQFLMRVWMDAWDALNEAIWAEVLRRTGLTEDEVWHPAGTFQYDFSHLPPDKRERLFAERAALEELILKGRPALKPLLTETDEVAE
jgi:hypothetical protein